MTLPRMLDLFCGRLGWSKAFLARGWECVGVDLVRPPEIPVKFGWHPFHVIQIKVDRGKFVYWSAGKHPMGDFDFICASSPCEEFSVHGMKHFHPNPKYPENGIKLFNHTREICEASGVPYVMENAKPAQRFVGQAVAHCGSFYLWGNAVPAILPQGIRKGATQMRRDGRYKRHGGVDELMYLEKGLRARTLATIPPELANCVAAYAERLLEQTKSKLTEGRLPIPSGLTMRRWIVDENETCGVSQAKRRAPAPSENSHHAKKNTGAAEAGA